MSAEPRTVPATASRLLRDYLVGLERVLPGAVPGVYVIGSAALDDHWAEHSDMDVLCEVARPLSEAETTALVGLHRGPLRRVQAYYRMPGRLLEVNEGRLDDPVTLTPVTLRELARHAIPVRGRVPDADPADEVVRAYCRENLESYWRTRLEQARTRCGQPTAEVSGAEVRWVAFGPARLWYTVHTGDIVSKAVAGAVAAARWPEVAPALADVLASRENADIRLTRVHLAAAVLLYDSIRADLGFPVQRNGAQSARPV